MVQKPSFVEATEASSDALCNASYSPSEASRFGCYSVPPIASFIKCSDRGTSNPGLSAWSYEIQLSNDSHSELRT